MKDELQPTSRPVATFFRYWLPALVWSILLLLASTPLMSSRNTGSGFATLIAAIIGHRPSYEVLWFVNLTIRKLVHLIVYGTEGLLMLRAVRHGRRGYAWPWIGQALAWTLVVACLDEWNQSRSPTRTGSVADVTLDLLGAALVILVVAARQLRKR